MLFSRVASSCQSSCQGLKGLHQEQTRQRSSFVFCNAEYEIRGILREIFVLDFESTFIRRARILIFDRLKLD